MSVRVYFDRHDLWIGVFWRPRYVSGFSAGSFIREPWTVYVCPIPTLVIRFRGSR